jgi:hypothetical protein
MIAELLAAGLLREARSGGVVKQCSSLQLHCCCSEVARFSRAVMEAKNHKELALDLVQIANAIPLGPVVIASAVVEAASKHGTLNFELFKNDRARSSNREYAGGHDYRFRMPDGTHIDLRSMSRDTSQFLETGELDDRPGGRDELGSMTADPRRG